MGKDARRICFDALAPLSPLFPSHPFMIQKKRYKKTKLVEKHQFCSIKEKDIKIRVNEQTIPESSTTTLAPPSPLDLPLLTYQLLTGGC